MTLPGEALPLGQPPPDHAGPADGRGRLPRARLRGARRPRGRDGRVQLRQARVPAEASGALAARHVLLRRRRGCCARRRRRRRSTSWKSASRRSTWSRSAASTGATRSTRRTSPIFHQFEGLAVDRGPDARGPARDAPARDAGAVRRRAPRPVPHALLPVHRAVDGARRLVPDLRRRGLPRVQALRLDRDGRLRHGRPGGLRERRLRPRGVDAASRSGWGSSEPPSCATRFPVCARSGRTTSAS